MSETADPIAVQALADAVAKADAFVFGEGGGRGVVTVGGGPYSYGCVVLAGMLRTVGYRGPIQVWHRGDAEPIPRKLLEKFDAEIVDASARAATDGVPLPSGWGAKAFAIARCPFDTVFFLDADAYPVADVGPAFERAELAGELFWPDYPNETLRWAKFSLDPRPRPTPVNGGQWLVHKPSRRKELAVYCALNTRDDLTHDFKYMYGDQDCQPLSWYACGSSYALGCRAARGVGPTMISDFPEGVPLVVHRVGSKFAPAGCFPGRDFAGPIRGLPLERQALRLYRDALDAVGVPTSRR